MHSTQMYRVTVASLALPLAVAAVSLGADQPMDAGGSGMHQMDQSAITPTRASKLIGTNVYNHQDKSLGEIKDLILDSSGQRVGYAVMLHGSVLGMGGKYVAIPYKDIEYSGGKDSKAYVSVTD